MRNTEVVTGKVRFSYLNVFTPRAGQDGGDPKYSVQLLIPKSDTATLGKINAAMKAAADAFRAKKGVASLPATPMTPLHDGDGTKPNSGEPYGPECKGCYVMSVSCSADQRPGVYDAFRQDILNPAEIKSGDYGRAHINFYGYSNKRKGIGAGLLAVQKLSDGDPLGGAVASASAFDDGFSDGDSDAFLL